MTGFYKSALAFGSARLTGRAVAVASALSLAACDLAARAPEAIDSPTVDEQPGEPFTVDDPAAALAFPGARGHGRHARGGRLGKLMFVTTLDDRGPGSLRACIEAEGPRVCLFRVGGVIRFTTERPLIRNPYLTIAGQTAPGGGVLLTHDGGPPGLTPVAIKQSHDIVIRHVRVRPDKLGERRNSNSGFTIEESRNVILDHVSASWARDENFTTQGKNDDITVSWSIFAEGLKPHDKCALLASDPRGPQNFSFIGNLCALNGDRNPDINFAPASCVEVVNNVFYGATGEFAEVWESNGGSPVSIVGNVFRAGPQTPSSISAITRWLIETRGDAQIYYSDNRIDGDFSVATDNVEAVRSDAPPCQLTSPALSASAAYDAVMTESGAFPRDLFDQRIVSLVEKRAGSLVSAPGVLPPIEGETAPEDLDNDGMADEWERASRIDDTIYNPWEDADGDGWLNLDEYLDHLHRQRVALAPAPISAGPR